MKIVAKKKETITKEYITKAEVPCMICDKIIQTLESPCKAENEKELHSRLMWDDGLIDVISAGYGSIHDEDVFLIGICDKCISKLKKDKKIHFLYNAMGM